MQAVVDITGKDRSLWSTLGYDALSLIWGIAADTLPEPRKRTLTAATVALRDRSPEELAALQEEILRLPAGRRVEALNARLPER